MILDILDMNHWENEVEMMKIYREMYCFFLLT